MATNYVSKIKESQTKRPGVLTQMALKRAKWTVIVYIVLCILMVGMIFAGVLVPGAAWKQV